MTDVITPRVIHQEYQRLSELLQDASDRLKEAATEHGAAEHAYRQAHATAVLSSSGTGVDKKAKADKTAESEMRKRNHWRAKELVAIEECRNLRQQLSTLSAAAYSVNSEIRLAGSH